ncbi:MAG: hypothetical protein N2039_00800 [Gemmataceae bacterium]|nr:hypothetical protein [Gemmataceae bacterium]
MRSLALSLIFAMLAAGCRREPSPQYPVRGVVLVSGRPLRGGTVVFAPDPRRGGRGPVSYGELDGEGRFELRNDVGPGAVRGWHRVTVAPPPDSDDLILSLERYRHPDLSGLSFEVRGDRENVAEFNLTVDHGAWTGRTGRP